MNNPPIKFTFSVLPSTSGSRDGHLDRNEVILRLRDRLQPILMYGETEDQASQRLSKLEQEEHETASGSKVDAK